MKIKKDYSGIMYFLILLPFFKTDFISRYEKISTFFSNWKYISIIFIFLYVIKKKKVSITFIYLLLFCTWFIITTLFNNGNLFAALNLFGSILALSYIVENNAKNGKFISALFFCFEIVIYVNFITMIFSPNGLYITGNTSIGTASENWFLGFKNTMVSYFLPGFILSYIHLNLTGRKLRSYLFNTIVFISAILCGSATTIVGIVVLLFFSIFSSFRVKSRLLNLGNYFIFSIIMFFTIIIFRLQNLFEFLLVDILQKDLTFTNRTTLWDITISRVKENFIFGYGWQDISLRHSMYNSQTIITSHNQMLEYIYMGGIIGIIFFIILIYYSIKNIRNNYDDKNIQIISLGFLVLQILNLTEVYFSPIMYITLIFTVYSYKFIINKEVGRVNEN